MIFFLTKIRRNWTAEEEAPEVSLLSNLIGNPYMFTGRRFDLETGLYYYRARYYNPQIGRFLQTDPIGYGDGMNWYNYCENNPLNFLDPSGGITVPAAAAAAWYLWPRQRNVTITSGHPWANTLCMHAIRGYGGYLHYTDSYACWNWVKGDDYFRETLKKSLINNFAKFHNYARTDFYIPHNYASDVSFDGWNHEFYPLSDTIMLKGITFFGEEAAMPVPMVFSSRFWIHHANPGITCFYTISFDDIRATSITIYVNLTLNDKMDLHPDHYFFDKALDKLNPTYVPYYLKMYLGLHKIELKYSDAFNETLIGIYIDDEEW